MKELARVVRAVARLERDRIPAEKECLGTGFLEIAGDAGVDAVNGRRDDDDDEHAHRDAENRECGTHAIGADRVQRNRHAFEEDESAESASHQVSCRMAAIGSSSAARLAG